MVNQKLSDYQSKKFNLHCKEIPKALIKAGSQSRKPKPKLKTKLENSSSSLPPKIQTFEQKLSYRCGCFIIHY